MRESAAALVFFSVLSIAQEKNKEWVLTAEVAGLLTSGNSESQTLGFSASIQRFWSKSNIKLDVGGTNTKSSITSRTAIGTTEDFYIHEIKETQKTAELL